MNVINKFDILCVSRHRISIDGNGITTLVALKGCPLNCKYCINKDILQEDSKQITPEQLLDKVMIDYCYFVGTNGGVTFGGGEPLLQYKAIKEFYELLPKSVNVNVETSLNVPIESVESLIDVISEWIIDIKDIDEQIYKAYTGLSNNKVLENLKYLGDKGIQDKCVIRIPNISKFNTDKNIKQSIEYLSDLGFNNFDTFEYVVGEE